MQDVLERDIREFAARDKFAVMDPRLIAAVFMGMLAALHQYLDRPGTKLTPQEIDERLAQIVDILLRGKQAWSLPSGL